MILWHLCNDTRLLHNFYCALQCWIALLINTFQVWKSHHLKEHSLPEQENNGSFKHPRKTCMKQIQDIVWTASACINHPRNCIDVAMHHIVWQIIKISKGIISISTQIARNLPILGHKYPQSHSSIQCISCLNSVISRACDLYILLKRLAHYYSV